MCDNLRPRKQLKRTREKENIRLPEPFFNDISVFEWRIFRFISISRTIIYFHLAVQWNRIDQSEFFHEIWITMGIQAFKYSIGSIDILLLNPLISLWKITLKRLKLHHQKHDLFHTNGVSTFSSSHIVIAIGIHAQRLMTYKGPTQIRVSS